MPAHARRPLHAARRERVHPGVVSKLRAALAGADPQPGALSGIASAVLVPLFVRDDGLHLLFTKRSEDLAHHRGQVAFPGGRHVAATDSSLLDTALRETHEEIGVEPSHVEVLGPLAPIHTVATNFVINPFVGLIPYPYEFRANPREVSDIFSVPLAALAEPSAASAEELDFGGRRVAGDRVSSRRLRHLGSDATDHRDAARDARRDSRRALTATTRDAGRITLTAHQGARKVTKRCGSGSRDNTANATGRGGDDSG